MGEEYTTAYPDNRERVAPEKVYKKKQSYNTHHGGPRGKIRFKTMTNAEAKTRSKASAKQRASTELKQGHEARLVQVQKLQKLSTRQCWYQKNESITVRIT
jgi:hypothetical protein